jgi:hypothetical protein
MNVYWIRCQNNAWCSLNTLNLNHKHFDNLRGVYIIWYWDSIDNPRTVKIGQGSVRQRLAEHRLDPQIQSYADRGLYVTWVNLPPHLLDGVERHLGDTLQPLVGSLFPAVQPIPVSLPW